MEVIVLHLVELCKFSLVLLVCPLFFQLIYTSLYSSSPDAFVTNQQYINQSVLSYFNTVADIIGRYLGLFIYSSNSLTTASTENILKFSNTMEQCLDTTATWQGFALLVVLLASYGVLFQWASVRRCAYEVTEPIIDAVVELWATFKRCVTAVWNSLDYFMVVIFSTVACVVLIHMLVDKK